MASNDDHFADHDDDHSHTSKMPTTIDNNHLLVANYSPTNQRYSTSHQANQCFSLDSADRHHDQVQLQQQHHCQSPAAARRRSSFKDFITYAFSFKSSHHTLRADYDYLISSLLCLNVFMSILNTILLSFVVKSLQLGDHKLLFGDGKLAWDTHLEGMVLNVPASIAQGHSLSVASIESHGRDKPLMISSFDGDDARESSIDQSSSSEESQSQLLISTGEQSASYIKMNDIVGQHDPSVAIETDSLLVNQLSKSSAANSKSNELKLEGKHRDKSSSSSKQQRGKVTAERMLELDTRRQLAVLPLLERIELAPPAASVLRVNNMLRCDSGTSGLFGANLDVQMRVGNLSCQSGRTLLLVSRSGKLNLAPLNSLVLDAPTLQMRAPTTRRLTISGLEFVNLEQRRRAGTASSKRRRAAAAVTSSQRDDGGEKQRSEGDELQLRQLQKVSRPRRTAGGLRAYNLVLVNGALMATSD